MRVKQGFLLREVAGSWIVVPIGQRVVEFNGLISLSESGAMIWKKLIEGATEERDLVKTMIGEYDVDEKTAGEDIREFLASMTERGLIENE